MYKTAFVIATLVCCVLACVGCAAATSAPEQPEPTPVRDEPTATEPAQAGESPEKTALIVHSYHAGFEWTDALDTGIRDALEPTGAGLVTVYMDTKRRASEQAKNEAGERAKLALEETKPDVVVTTDDNAQRYFAMHYAGDADAPHFVFAGVNAEPEEYGYPAENVTGVLERPKFAEGMALLLELVPELETIAVVTDDSPTSSEMIRYVKTLDLPVEVVAYEQPGTFAEWQAAVLEHQLDADSLAFFLYHTVKAEPDDPDSMDAKQVIAWTLANNEKPTMGIIDFSIADGALCGVVESGEEQGREAGRMAAEILAGKRAGDMPIVILEEGACAINMTTALRLNIEVPESLLETCDIVE